MSLSLITRNMWELLMEKSILEAYVPGETSLREVALLLKTNHHTVRRCLERNGVKVIPARRKPFSATHRARLSKAMKGRKCWCEGKKMPKNSLYKNMAAHLRFDVGWEWLSQFDDIEKLKVLNRSVTERGGRMGLDTESYKYYVSKFYFCEKFNAIYQAWLKSGKDHYLTPSIDHIVPRAAGGLNEVSNFQFLTWFENRCKNDMSQADWDRVKSDISSYFI